MQNRLKSPALWVSVGLLIAFVSKTYMGYEIPRVDELVDMIIVVCIGFGILNNPTNPNGL